MGENSSQQDSRNFTTKCEQSNMNISSPKSAVKRKPTSLTTYFKQSDGNVSSQKSTVSSIFKGISIYVNGRTDPPPEKLKRLILTHGGRYIYYPCKSNITHIIASNSSYTKIRELKNGRAVLPSWITDSVEAGRLLPDAHYLYQASKSSKMPASGHPSKDLGSQKVNMKTTQELARRQDHGKIVARQFRERNGDRNLKRAACPQLPSVDVKSTSVKPVEGKSHLYSEGYHPVGPFNKQQFNGCYFPKSTDPDFLAIFYSHSRLHHLTTWKAKHKAFVKKLQQNGDHSFPGREELKKLISSRGVQNQRELKRDEIVADRADAKDGTGLNGRGQSSKKDEPVIMHIDMDCFFVAVSMLNYPELKGKPVAVAHYAWKSDGSGPRSESKLKDKELWAAQHKAGAFSKDPPKRNSNPSNFEGKVRYREHSKQRQSLLSSIASERENFSSLAEIASCSYEARKAGVKNGMIMKNAKQLCPDLRTIPYDFEGYYRVSRQLYEIVARYTHDIEACSCDELLVDITRVLEDTRATPLEFAQVLREEIYEKTKCTASAGIASSAVLARLCTRVAKPDGIHQLQEGEEAQLLNSVPVRELPGVGGSISKKLQNLGIFTCADLQQLTLNEIQKEFGPKTGHILYQHCRGQDDKPLSMERERKYVSVEVNYGIRFQTEDDVIEFVYRLGGELHKRLKDLGMVGRTITVKLKVRRAGTPKEDTKFMGYGVYDNRIRSQTLRQETDDIGTIQRECRNILRQLNAHPEDIRGVGVQISRLKNVSSVVGVTKSLEDMLPKKTDVLKRSTSMDSFPSTSKTSENPKSYSLLNFVQPKRKLSLDEDLMRCKSKKTDASSSSKIKSASRISSEPPFAALFIQKQEIAPSFQNVKREPSSSSDVGKVTFFGKGSGKRESSWKDQSSSQFSQKFDNSVKVLKAGRLSSTVSVEKIESPVKENGIVEVSSKPQSSLHLSQKFENITNPTEKVQASSAAVSETESPSKMQSPSQFLQKYSNAMKSMKKDQPLSASVSANAAPFATGKGQIESVNIQISQQHSNSEKSMRKGQFSSASDFRNTTQFAKAKSQIDTSNIQSTSQCSQQCSNSEKSMKGGHCLSSSVLTGKQEELPSKMQKSSQYLEKHNPTNLTKEGQSIPSAPISKEEAQFVKDKGQTGLSSKMQSLSQFSYDRNNSLKSMKVRQSQSSPVVAKTPLLANEKNKTEYPPKVRSTSQFSQEHKNSLKPQCLSASVPGKATFTRKETVETELRSKMQSSSQLARKFDNTVKTLSCGTMSGGPPPSSTEGSKIELSLKEKGSTHLSSDCETSLVGLTQSSPSVARTPDCSQESFDSYSQERSSQEEDSDVLYTKSGKRFTQIEDPEFLTEFYRHSKYHLMSSWRVEHKSFVKKLRSRENGKFPGLEKFKIFMNSKDSVPGGNVGAQDNGNAASQNSRCTTEPSQNAPLNDVNSVNSLPDDKSVIMHVDMDCFFVAVSLMKFPELQGAPLAVAHAGAKPMQNMWFDDCDRSFLEKKKWKNRSSESVEISHKERVNSPVPKNAESSEGEQSDGKQGQGKKNKMTEWETTYYNSMAEISSCSYEARAAGVEKGMLLADAVTLCPNLLTLPYDFEKYHEVSKLLYETVGSFTDEIEAVSCDEMFIDITKILRDTGTTAMEVAHFIRDEILAKTKCTASAGIASNTLLARLCTRIAKPNGIFQLEDDKVEDFMKTWPVRDLPGVGESIGKKLLAKFEIQSCADLQKLPLSALQKEFGPKTGQILYQACRGQAEKPIRMEKERKYVSVDVNFGIRFKNEEEVMDFIYRMADEMHKRLKDVKMAGRKLTIKLKVKRPGIVRNSQDDSRFLGTGQFDSKYRSVTLPQETDDLATIKREFKSIYLSLKVDPEDVRGVGVQLSRLKKVSNLLGVTKSLEEMMPKKSDLQKMSPPTSPDKNLSPSKTPTKPKKYSLLNFVTPKRKSSSDESFADCKAKKINESMSSTDESELESSSSQSTFFSSKDEDALEKDTDGDASLNTTKVTQTASLFEKGKAEGIGETRRCKVEESCCSSKISKEDLDKSKSSEVKQSNILKNTGIGTCQSKIESHLGKGESAKVCPSKITNYVTKAKAAEGGQPNISKNTSRSEFRVESSSEIAKNMSERESGGERNQSKIAHDLSKNTANAEALGKGLSDMGKNASQEEPSTKCMSVRNGSVIPSSKPNKTYTQVSDPGFLAQFYQNSKFHHISTWKVEHKTFIHDLQKKEEKKFPGKQKLQMFTKKEDTASSETEESPTEHSISKTYFGSGRTIFDHVGPERIVWENKSVILHIDMDCFFVSVSLLNYPELHGKPLAVAHTGVKSSQVRNIWYEDSERAYLEKRTWKNPATNCIEISCKERVHPYGMVQDEGDGENLGGTPGVNGENKSAPLEATYLNSMAEVASCSYEAREAGVENGMLLVEAKSLCPDLRTIPYDFENYHKVSRILYEIVASFTNEIEAVSCDEMFVDITKILRDTGAAPMEFAHLVRDEIFAKTQCTASVGIASNTLLARLCTRVAKPNGIFLLEDSKVDDFMKSVPVRKLPGIGEAISQKLLMLGVTTCGEMQELSLTVLQRYFGTRTGHDLYQHCRGKNDQPIKTEREQKLVSSTVNYGIRFKSNDDALKFITELAEVVHKKLQKTGMRGRTIMLKLKIRRKGTPQEELKFMGHGICENKTRTISLRQETDDLAIIKRESYALYWQMGAPPRDIRGVGLHITRLKKSSSSSSKSLIDMLPKKSDLSKSSTSSSFVKSPSVKSNSVNSPSSPSPFSTFFTKKGKGEPRFFFPEEDDDDEVFKEEENGCHVTEKKGISSSPIQSSPDKPIFSPKPVTMFGSSPTKRDREYSDTSSNSPLNSPSNLDPEVLRSLPPDILKEVLEEERSKMKKTQNMVEKLGKVEDLPSFSKINLCTRG